MSFSILTITANSSADLFQPHIANSIARGTSTGVSRINSPAVGVGVGVGVIVGVGVSVGVGVFVGIGVSVGVGLFVGV